MRIKRVALCRITVPFEVPLPFSFGEMTGGHNLIIRITTDAGIAGIGEASPFPFITGDDIGSNIAYAKILSSHLVGRDPLAINDRMEDIYDVATRQPSLHSAFDMALYDIAAKHADIPLYRFLGGEKRPIWTDYTVGMHANVQQTLEEVRRVCDAGFRHIKLKVGREAPQDITFIRKVRALIGHERVLSLDCNRGWAFDTALTVLSEVTDLNICHCEEPLRSPDVEALARLRSSTKVPICLDESVTSEQDALNVIKGDAADVINIKLGRIGGMHRARRINEIARANNTQCMIGCFAESRIGLAAAAHFSIANRNVHYFDLDSAYQTLYDPVLSGFSYDVSNDGSVSVSESAGLGTALNETLLPKFVDIG